MVQLTKRPVSQVEFMFYPNHVPSGWWHRLAARCGAMRHAEQNLVATTVLASSFMLEIVLRFVSRHRYGLMSMMSSVIEAKPVDLGA